jgi:L-lysine exporter family protein LysE/ArgO
VNALAVVRGLRFGASQAFLLTAGAGTADVLYAALVILGAGPFMNRPIVQIVLSLGGGVFLARLGIMNLRAVVTPLQTDAPDGGGVGSWAAAYRTGLMTALLSPLTIVFWMSVFGGFYADRVARGSQTSPVLLLGVLLCGAWAWTCILAGMIQVGRKVVAGRGYRLLVTTLSLVLLGFAARLLWSGFEGLRHAQP